MSERLAAIRERLNRREKKIRAGRRARERRIDREEPQGSREAAAVKVRKAKAETSQSAEEARELAADAKTLVATELGISTDEAESVIEDGASMFDRFSGGLDGLDGDRDGDTDLLGALDAAVENESGGQSDTRSDDALAEAVGGDFGAAEAVDPGGSGSGGAFDPMAADIDLSDDRS